MLHITPETFEIEAKRSSKPTIVMFYAIWCGKCAMMKPMVKEIEEKVKGKIKFCEVDIEECVALATEYEVDIVPTFVFFRDGEVFSYMQGLFSQETFERRVHDLLVWDGGF